MKLEFRGPAGLVSFAWALSASGAGAGQVDAGTYLLTYADALGAPVVSTVGESTAYTFAAFVVGDSYSDYPHLYDTEQDAGPVVVTAAPGFRIAATLDVTFPIHGELQVMAADGRMAATGSSFTVAKSAYITYSDHWGVEPEFGDRSISRGQYGKVLPNSYTDEARVSFLASALAFDYGVEATFKPVVYVDSRYITTAVPEPGTFAMLLAGLGVLLGWRRFAVPAYITAPNCHGTNSFCP